MRPTTDRYRLLVRLAVGGAAVAWLVMAVWLCLDRDLFGWAFGPSPWAAIADEDSAHPLVAGLADGRIGPGDPIDAVIAEYPPRDVLRHGPWTTAFYSDNGYVTHLAARDGRLVYARHARAGRAGRTFFTAYGPGEETTYHASYLAAGDTWPGVLRARMAVAGTAVFAGWLDKLPGI